RNPHCSGGILYVTQGLRDRDKGDLESYQRQITKAVAELQQCTTEDPQDFEAMGYLGWALAEVDSSGPAGEAFEKAIAGLRAKGDKKKTEMVIGNRNSFWARSFNDGIKHMQDAQELYPEFKKEPADDNEKTMKEEAAKHYQAAMVSLTHESRYKKSDPQTLRNLGSVHVFMGESGKAEAVFIDALKQVPGDSSLTYALRTARVGRARDYSDAKDFDKAIGAFTDLIKAEPNDSDHHLGLADAYFRRAQSKKEEEGRAADFKLAGDSYARAGELKADADLPFNAALAYQHAKVWDKSETQWRVAIKMRTEDVDARAALAEVLAEQKKFEEAVQVLHEAVLLKPQNKNLHRQFGSVYTKVGNNVKATEELMVYLAMQNGQPSPDPAAVAKAAPAGSDAAKTLASEGTPDQTIAWSAEQENYESWFYWAKNRAYTFKQGRTVTRSDWARK
ncbi:MAG: tetratricopeptide repeat protein, partial [Betaproteobacteria bacterium]